MDRRTFLVSAASGIAAARIGISQQEALAWHDVKTWGVEGKGFAETTRPVAPPAGRRTSA